MNGGEAPFSRESDEWTTPQWLFDELDREFRFTLDACASEENHKCFWYYTKEDDALEKDWGGQSVFCNPPYSKVKAFVKKAFYEGQKDGTTVVLLIPARTDTTWFHNYCLYHSEIRFIQGRLRFSGANVNAPFPSMIVIFRGAREMKRRKWIGDVSAQCADEI